MFKIAFTKSSEGSFYIVSSVWPFYFGVHTQALHSMFYGTFKHHAENFDVHAQVIGVTPEISVSALNFQILGVNAKNLGVSSAIVGNSGVNLFLFSIIVILFALEKR